MLHGETMQHTGKAAMHCCCSCDLIAGCRAGGLLNVTFGNAVELILSIVALMKGLYVVVEYSLIGSVLSNTLLVLGAPSSAVACRLLACLLHNSPASCCCWCSIMEGCRSNMAPCPLDWS